MLPQGRTKKARTTGMTQESAGAGTGGMQASHVAFLRTYTRDTRQRPAQLEAQSTEKACPTNQAKSWTVRRVRPGEELDYARDDGKEEERKTNGS